MSTNIVQSSNQKCLELHNCVPIILGIFWGGPTDPPFTCNILGCVLRNSYTIKMLKMSPKSVWVKSPLFSRYKAKKKKRKKIPPFLN